MLEICKSVLIEFAPSKEQKENKHPKFDYNFNIRHQLGHFEYEMNRTSVIHKFLSAVLLFQKSHLSSLYTTTKLHLKCLGH